MTVQLPIFNEASVIRRLLNAVGELDYPRERLEIQILDDSTDETRVIAREEAARLEKSGMNVELIQRDDRVGFKAGALAEGMRVAHGELIYILDADFVPPADALKQLVGHFEDEQIGLVQTRWGHLNREVSILTRVQSIFLDGHFQLEQYGPQSQRTVLPFQRHGRNVAQALHRRRGWMGKRHADRRPRLKFTRSAAWLEIPLSERHRDSRRVTQRHERFKSQQHRWAKGAIQNCKKLLVPIWRSDAPLKAKFEATVQLTCNFTYLLMIALVLLLLPGPDVSFAGAWIVYSIIFWLTTGAVVLFYTCSTRKLYPKTWAADLLHLPMALALGAGMCVNNSKGVIGALFGRASSLSGRPNLATKPSAQNAVDRLGRHGLKQRSRSTSLGWAYALSGRKTGWRRRFSCSLSLGSVTLRGPRFATGFMKNNPLLLRLSAIALASSCWLLAALQTSCVSMGKDTANVVYISVPEQRAELRKHGERVAVYPVSTSKYGVGDQPGSYRTPLGRMEIAQKIGSGKPSGTVFKSRKPTGEILPPNAPGRDPIVSRIMWLKGKEWANRNAYNRYIYIHGTPVERHVGRAVSYGCIRMRSADVIDLYSRVGTGARVVIKNAPLLEIVAPDLRPEIGGSESETTEIETPSSGQRRMLTLPVLHTNVEP